MIKDILDYEGAINQIFMVKSASRAVSSNGSYYLNIVLQDITGTLDAKKWSIDEDDQAILVSGAIVRIEGILQQYKGHPQLKINDIEPVNENDIDLAKYIPTAPVPIEVLNKKLESYIDMITDADLKKITRSLIDENYKKYTTYPAAVSVHHAYLNGLIFHSISICSMAICACDQYPILNKNYLIAGSLLHDIGKTKELSGVRGSEYTLEGNLLGHISMGAMMVYNKGKELNLPSEKVDVLTHMILSHHGKLEYGSPKLPMTAEAYVLHVLDELDAKLEVLRVNLQGVSEGQFAGRVTWLDNTNFYKPKSE